MYRSSLCEFETRTANLRAGGILIVWYASATLAARHIYQLLLYTKFESVEVSFLFMIAGSLLTIINMLYDSTFNEKVLTAYKMRSTHQAALFHYIGTLSMCMAQAAVSASLTQIVKSTEPVLTIALSSMLTGTFIEQREMIGVIFISGGVSLMIVFASGDQKLDNSGVAYALISACCFPLRNLASYKCADSLTSTQRFGLTSACACIPALLLCLMKWIFLGDLTLYNLSSGHLAISSMAHVGYNVASYAFLSSSSPIIHSVANILKRVVVIMLMFFMEGTMPSLPIFVGLFLLVSGFVLCSEIKLKCKQCVVWMLPLLVMATVSVAFFPGNVMLGLGLEQHKIANETSAVPSKYSPAGLLSCIVSIRRRHLHELKDVFRRPQFQAHPILLVDPAQHENLGDTLLVLGEIEFLNAMGWGERSVHECGVTQAKAAPRCPAVLNASAPGMYKLALWHAGGNWGNVWAGVQYQRIRSMSYLIDAQLTVVSMPQSMHYDNDRSDVAAMKDARAIEAAAARIGGANESRKRLVFLWRQNNSFEAAERLYPFADNRLVPDIAFWCGPFLHHGAAAGLDGELVDLLLLLRTDKESVLGGKGSDSHKTPDKLRQMVDGAGRNLSFRVADWAGSRPLRTVDPAEYRPKIEAAVRLLHTGRVVIADRLHAAILSMLSLRPVFYVDQRYGKIRRTLDVAFAGSDACRDEGAVRVFRTAGLGEAVSRAGRFVEECKASGECL